MSQLFLAKDIATENSKWISRIDFLRLSSNDPNSVDYICKYPNKEIKEKFIILVKYKNYKETVTQPEWVFNNSIQFIIECHVDGNMNETQWKNSGNYYTVCVCTNYAMLEQTLLDIMIDVSVEDKILTSGKFKGIKNSFINAISNKKVEFIKKEKLQSSIDEQIGYYPFAVYFRSEQNYDIHSLHNFWSKFLLYMSGKLDGVRQIRNAEDFIRLFIGKQHGGINDTKVMDVFNNKCVHKGFYVYAKLVKSVIGQDAKRKRRVKNIFGSLKTSSFTFKPYIYSHEMDNMENLIETQIFEFV